MQFPCDSICAAVKVCSMIVDNYICVIIKGPEAVRYITCYILHS